MATKKKAKAAAISWSCEPGDEVMYDGHLCTVVALHRGGKGWNLMRGGSRMFKAVPARKIKRS